MADCYPVYRFNGYFRREYIYYGSNESQAFNFVLAYNSLETRKNGAYLATSRPLPADAKLNHYKGWTISFDYGYWNAVHDDYDAEWKGEEDGWVDNGRKLSERTFDDLLLVIELGEWTPEPMYPYSGELANG